MFTSENWEHTVRINKGSGYDIVPICNIKTHEVLARDLIGGKYVLTKQAVPPEQVTVHFCKSLLTLVELKALVAELPELMK
jgi:hypothetical protein